jgi:spore coat polysaccharide biosynthesis predicted glycosyltransferase SpsG
MRCLALAQAWQSAGHRAIFAVGKCPATLCERLLREGCAVKSVKAARGSSADGSETIAIAERLGSRNLVLDGDAFDEKYQKQIKQAGLRLLLLEDYIGAGYYSADWIWNADLPSGEEAYPRRGPGTRLLLGPRYALLRREFLTARPRERSALAAPAPAKVLITFGGSDPQNATLEALRGLAMLKDSGVQARVLVGGANPRLDLLQAAARELAGNVEVLSDVQDMPAQMLWADIAVVASGVTVWELLYMGVAVIAWPRYPADLPSLELLAKGGAVTVLEADANAGNIANALRTLLLDGQRIRRMSDAGQKLVDGRGAERVARLLADALQDLHSSSEVSAR